MEVCGGQTHTIVKYGIDRLLPEEVELVHGPGCPVCVTSLEMIDKAHAIAQRPDVIFCSFGDMLRVPGSRRRSAHPEIARRGRPRRLFADRLPEDRARESGQEGRLLRHRFRNDRAGQCDVRLAGARSRASRISPCSSRTSSCRRPSPPSCSRRSTACRDFSVRATFAPSWATAEYEPHRRRVISVPIVITGFEPIDILEGTLMTVRQLEAGTARSGKPISARRESRGQSRRAGSGQQGLRSLRPQMARRRLDSEERLQTALRISRPRRRADFRREGDRHAGAGDLHQRPGLARA